MATKKKVTEEVKDTAEKVADKATAEKIEAKKTVRSAAKQTKEKAATTKAKTEAKKADAKEVKAAVEALTKDGIKAFLSPDILALTVDEIVNMLMQSAMGTNESEPITLEYLIEMIKESVLPTPLVAVLGEDTVEWIMKTEVNKLFAELALVIGENFAFEGIKFSTGIDINFPEFVYDYDYENDDYIRSTIGNSIQIEVSLDLAIEDAVTVIELPKDAVILDNSGMNGGGDDYVDMGTNEKVPNEEFEGVTLLPVA